MDIERLKKLSGQGGTLVETWKQVKVADNASKAASQSAKKQKENNTTGSNKTATDVRTTDKQSDIANDVSAELVDTDDTSLNAKDGKKDAAGQKVIKAGERLYHTISIGDNGAPKIDDSTTLDTVDTEKWGEYGEGYVVSSTEGNVYVSEITDQILLGSADISEALVFETMDAAEVVAKLFKHAEIRKVEKVHPLLAAAEDCNDDFIAEDEDKHTASELSIKVKLDESIKDDINDRIKSGKSIQMSVNYNGKNLTGHITQANDGVLRIHPTAKTQKRFNLSDKEIIVPVDHNALHWSDDHADRIVGFAKDTKGDLAPDSNLSVDDTKGSHAGSTGRGTKADFTTAFKGQKKSPKKAAATWGTKDASGRFDDPKSWGITAGFNGPDGKSLNEYASEIRTG